MRLNSIKVKVLLAQNSENVSDFCKRNELAYSTVTALLNHKRVGNIKTIGNIAKALNVPISDILED